MASGVLTGPARGLSSRSCNRKRSGKGKVKALNKTLYTSLANLTLKKHQGAFGVRGTEGGGGDQTSRRQRRTTPPEREPSKANKGPKGPTTGGSAANKSSEWKGSLPTSFALQLCTKLQRVEQMCQVEHQCIYDCASTTAKQKLLQLASMSSLTSVDCSIYAQKIVHRLRGYLYNGDATHNTETLTHTQTPQRLVCVCACMSMAYN